MTKNKTANTWPHFFTLLGASFASRKYWAAGILIFALSACQKSLNDVSEQFPLLNPAQSDANAGDWRPILLASPAEFTVPAPLPVFGAPYTLELNEIKALQKNISNDQLAQINYWGAGTVLRWNETMRALVAKRNLPPVNNPDGTYPIPSAANPFGYPEFPFSNPPYAARAYAYLSVAQYDALVACAFYRRLYNRQAPYQVDAQIKTLVPVNNQPSYPSEEAVVTGATLEIMRRLFPADIAYVQAKADQLLQAKLTAGVITRSDWEAGLALGRSVGLRAAARAGNDNMARAVGTPAEWAALEANTLARNEVPWISLDIPKRPPMLPNFGRVRPFLFDSLTTIALRAPAPPSTRSEQFQKELDEVRAFAKNPTREQTRIAHFWADGVGTYTPPGHWNAIAAEDFVAARFSEVRWARNLALLNMSLMDAAITCWDTKYYYYNPRPSQMDPSIRSTTGVPNFPAYTSGHSTFSGAAATILGHIIPARAGAYEAMAKEASMSRLYGAIHYRSDCEVGLLMGKRVGEYAIARARTDGAN